MIVIIFILVCFFFYFAYKPFLDFTKVGDPILWYNKDMFSKERKYLKL